MTTRAQVLRRLADGNFQGKGEFDILTASGGWYEGRIGYGKVTAPAEEVLATQVQADDLVCVWQDDPQWPRRVAQFIVQARQYSGEGTMELSGPNYLGVLNDLIVLDRIGTRTWVNSQIESFRPHPSNDPVEYAAYGPRYYQSGSGSPPGAGDTYFVTHTKVISRVGDTLVIDFSSGAIVRPLFVTTITDVSDGNTRISFADGLPYELPPLTRFTLYSTMINVADASVFTIGEEVKITATPPSEIPEGYNPLIISRVKDAQVVANNSDYIEIERYIPFIINVGYWVVGVSYTDPTYTDVEDMLRVATDDQWRVNRSPLGYPGTMYEPNGETVFQVMQALSEQTGWTFRLNMNDAIPLPSRKIDYFPPGNSYPMASATALLELGTKNKVGQNYGEIIELTSEDSYAAATHVVPYGGGSGETRFSIGESNLFEILASYTDDAGQPLFSWGSTGRDIYIFRKAAVTQGKPPRWKVLTFSNIYPENEASPADRRRAADSLLNTTCQWLKKNGGGDTVYKVTCFTLADPRPGDWLEFLDYRGVETFPLSQVGMYIAEVHHEVTEPSGLRLTKLTLTRTASHYMTGEDMAAAAMQDAKRQGRSQNVTHRGSGRMDYDGATWRGAATLRATEGALTLTTANDGIEIDSGRDVLVRADLMDVRASIKAAGAVEAGGGVILPDEDGGRWNVRFIVVRGTPVLIAEG